MRLAAAIWPANGGEELVELVRTLDETQTGAEVGPDEKDHRPHRVQAHGLEVLGEHQLARLVVPAALDQGDRRPGTPNREAVRSAGDLDELLDELSVPALEVTHVGQLQREHQGASGWPDAVPALERLDAPIARRLRGRRSASGQDDLDQETLHGESAGSGTETASALIVARRGLDRARSAAQKAMPRLAKGRHEAEPRVIQALGQLEQLGAQRFALLQRVGDETAPMACVDRVRQRGRVTGGAARSRWLAVASAWRRGSRRSR